MVSQKRLPFVQLRGGWTRYGLKPSTPKDTPLNDLMVWLTINRVLQVYSCKKIVRLHPLNKLDWRHFSALSDPPTGQSWEGTK